MKFKITDDWRIETDTNQWIVSKFRGIRKSDTKGHKAGEEIWIQTYYYPTLDKAAVGLLHRLARDSSAETPTQALADIERASAALTRALPRITVNVAVQHEEGK